jgi:hypothetical protein
VQSQPLVLCQLNWTWTPLWSPLRYINLPFYQFLYYIFDIIIFPLIFAIFCPGRGEHAVISEQPPGLCHSNLTSTTPVGSDFSTKTTQSVDHNTQRPGQPLIRGGRTRIWSAVQWSAKIPAFGGPVPLDRQVEQVQNYSTHLRIPSPTIHDLNQMSSAPIPFLAFLAFLAPGPANPSRWPLKTLKF